MKLFCLFFLFACAAAAQTFTLGVQGGVPLGGGFAGHPEPPVTYTPVLRPYSVGPVAEVALPRNLRLQAGALYHRIGWDLSRTATQFYEPYQATVRIGSWDFTALVKRRIGTSKLRPFAAAGPAFRRFFTTRYESQSSSGTVSIQMVGELRYKNVPGLAAAFGFETGGRVVLSPQVRYTRWLLNNVYPGFRVVSSQVNQLDILFLFTFRLH